MSVADYEQISIPSSLAGDALPFLKDGMVVTLDFYNEEAISITPPETAICEITDCEPVVKVKQLRLLINLRCLIMACE